LIAEPLNGRALSPQVSLENVCERLPLGGEHNQFGMAHFQKLANCLEHSIEDVERQVDSLSQLASLDVERNIPRRSWLLLLK
jgi:hypothetical protein